MGPGGAPGERWGPEILLGIRGAAASAGRYASRLLLASLAFRVAGEVIESPLLVDASSALALAGAAAGGLWAACTIESLRREGSLCLLEAYSTMALWSLSPWGLAASVEQALGEAVARLRGSVPVPGDGDPVVSPPFRGCWLVVNGGVTRDDSHSWGLVSQRYAYDLVRAEDGERIARPCIYRRLSDWATYGSPVLAVLDGVVVRARDGVPDNEPVGRVMVSARSLAGNYVVVKHGEGLYSLYAHLRRGSLVVEEGERVREGDVIGEAGNSGLSTAPHLHFQLMTSPNLKRAVSIPFRVRGLTVEGKPFSGYARRGQVVCSPEV